MTWRARAMGCFISTEKRTQRVTKNNSFKFLTVCAAQNAPETPLTPPSHARSQQHGAASQPLERCAQLFTEADLDKDGKVRHAAPCAVFCAASLRGVR